MNIDKIINDAIKDSFKKEKEESLSFNQSSNIIKESYVTQAGKFDLKTELLSEKTKKSHQALLEGYVKKLNEVSSKLDSADTSEANLNNSEFRSLKIDETYNLNAAFLHGLYFQNISDLNSQVSTDSLSYIKLSRDFGTFDNWQEDFIACSLSARNGWAVTLYSTQLKRYVNTVIDLHSQNVMIGMQPLIVIDCWEHSYYRDYLKDRKTYVFAMMKELNWNVIEERFKQAEKIHKILGA
jgi:Fe-Mn family superoxide dismutase